MRGERQRVGMQGERVSRHAGLQQVICLGPPSCQTIVQPPAQAHGRPNQTIPPTRATAPMPYSLGAISAAGSGGGRSPSSTRTCSAAESGSLSQKAITMQDNVHQSMLHESSACRSGAAGAKARTAAPARAHHCLGALGGGQ